MIHKRISNQDLLDDNLLNKNEEIEEIREISILVRYWLWIVDKDLTIVWIPSANNRLSTDREIEKENTLKI